MLCEHCVKEKKRKDYAFRRQFNEKPSITPGCPATLCETRALQMRLYAFSSRITKRMSGPSRGGGGHSHTSGCRSWLLPQQVPFIISNLNPLSANV